MWYKCRILQVVGWWKFTLSDKKCLTALIYNGNSMIGAEIGVRNVAESKSGQMLRTS